MKTFTFRNGDVTPGLDVVDELHQGGSGVCLGQYGFGCRAISIPMDRVHPPTVGGDGKTHDVFLKDINRNRPERRPFFVLAEDQCVNIAILVRISTKGGDGGQDGFVEFGNRCNSYELVCGWGCNKDLPASGLWNDSIICLVPGDRVTVHIGGCDQIFQLRYLNGAVLVEKVGGHPEVAAPVLEVVKIAEPVPASILNIAPTTAPAPENDGQSSSNGEDMSLWAELGRKQVAKFNARYGRDGRNWHQLRPVVCGRR